MPKPFIASRVYLKPLVPERMFQQGDPEAILKRARRDLMRRLKQELTQTAFSDRAKRALAKALTIEIKKSSLQVTANHPAFAPLVKGQKSGQMTWLTKARRPIPIITETGELIFRNASAKSMRDGKWIHPGRNPSTFIDRAKKTSRAFLKEKFEKELRKKIRASWSR
jgi:hypothetical protein